MKSYIAIALAAPALVSAQQSLWGQCGGIGWTGQTTCVSGASCQTLNPYYAQCLPGTATTTARTTTTSSTTAIVTTTPTTFTTRSSTTTSSTSAPVGTGLNNLIKSKGKKYFGFCADPNTLNDASTTNIMKAEGGQVTPENSMKWENIEPSQNSFSWGNADTLVNWATSNNQLIRGHTFTWHSQLPQWVKNISNKATLTSVIQAHVAAVAGRYKGKIYAWDVANEIFNDDGSIRTSVFSQVFGGTGFLDVAFKAARAADPNAKLCLNDYNLDYSSAKLTNFVALVKQLIANGTPIDCVGTQSHLVVGNGAIPSFKSTLDSLASTGLEVQITELDIRGTTPLSSSALSQQSTDYKNVVSACMKTSKCAGITVWGVSDKNSWVPATFPGQGAALIWNDSYQKKACYQGTVDGINS
jgi:endo-1,4-beta-xylanase